MEQRRVDVGPGSGWVVVYPAYLDRATTIADGRRVPQAKACDKVHIIDLAEACQYLRIPCIPEPRKRYCRDTLRQGRVRAMLKDPDGSPVKEGVTTRRALFALLAQTIPTLPNREERVKAIEQRKMEMSVHAGVTSGAAVSAQKAAAASVPGGAASSPKKGAARVSSSSKKKGKKKKGRK